MIVCVAGNPSIDKLFEVDRLEHGDIHRPDHFVALPGGKGIHVAQVAKALGGEAIVTGILAGHAGRWIVDQLAAEGVDGRFVWGQGETRSSLSVADRQTGCLTEFYEAGSPSNDEEWGHLERLTADLLPLGSWLALAGSMPLGTPDDGFSRMIALAHEAGVPTALDSRSEGLAQTLSARPTVVKINVHEAAELLEREIDGVDEVKQAAFEIRDEIGGEGHAAVITMGEEGVVAVDPEGRVHRGRLYERGSYPVGSGDALLGGLLAGLDRNDPWPDAIALALGAATANAEIPGAGHLDPARARELAARAEITELSG
jgi:1-phosphofructokinase family hexose kinase